MRDKSKQGVLYRNGNGASVRTKALAFFQLSLRECRASDCTFISALAKPVCRSVPSHMPQKPLKILAYLHVGQVLTSSDMPKMI